jgi:hypothetical protein
VERYPFPANKSFIYRNISTTFIPFQKKILLKNFEIENLRLYETGIKNIFGF